MCQFDIFGYRRLSPLPPDSGRELLNWYYLVENLFKAFYQKGIETSTRWRKSCSHLTT
ncbi:hypothetical protein F7734_06680 [Scytonema sp. UIC 10036]|nr:hypothetical protein [Scytonema sp. UIC 10036]